MLKARILSIVAGILMAFGVRVGWVEPLKWGSGVYTNLCGAGMAANWHGCSGECDPSKGTCSSGNFFVAKWVCEGRAQECSENESWSNVQILSGTGCGKTVVLDVFTKNCRENGWSCTEKDLKDYMVWYSGDCPSTSSGLPQFTATPSATGIIRVSPTRRPTIVPAPTVVPTAIPTAVPTEVPQPTEIPEPTPTVAPTEVLTPTPAEEPVVQDASPAATLSPVASTTPQTGDEIWWVMGGLVAVFIGGWYLRLWARKMW